MRKIKKYDKFDIKINDVVYCYNERHEIPWMYDSGKTRAFPHTKYEMIYLKEGSYTSTIYGKETLIKKGALILTRRCTISPYINKSRDLPFFYYAIVFNSDNNFNFDFFENEVTVIYPKNTYDIEKQFIKALDIYIKEPITFNLELSSIVMHLLSEIIISYYEKEDTIQIPDTFDNVISYIYQNVFKENISIENLAKIANLSVGYFTRLFTKHYGMAPKKYINKIKLNRATELLQHEYGNIFDIALTSGFNDIPYFNRLFKEEYGITPTEYRNKKSPT